MSFVRTELAPLPARKRIALVAHDHEKDSLLAWARVHRDALAKHELFGTGTTGGMIASELGLPVHRFLSGPIGGELQQMSAFREGAKP